jgi:O-Antigen ligase/Virulence factor membrane-bound polymerase, C-terminal
MASSDALPGAAAATAEAQGSDAWAGCLLGLALVLPWWLPLLGNASATFFKEALTLVLVGFAGVAAAWPDRRDPNARVHPLALATLVLALVLVVHALAFDYAWRKALLAASGLATFWISLRTSAHLREQDGKRAFDRLAACVATAALGSCVFAGLQLFGLDAAVPGVLPRSGDRLSGNVDQANQFADLLWLGAIAVVWLAATEVLPWTLAAATLIVLEFFVVTSGSRTVWVYVAFALALGSAAWLTLGGDNARGRLAIGLVAIALSQVAISVLVVTTHMLAPLQITAAEQRIGTDSADESTSERLWFWRSGLATAADHPVLGVGIGRLAGSAREHVVAASAVPLHSADAHAHNLFVQVAAEMGFPVALVLFGALVAWAVLAWRRRPPSASNIAGLAMAGVMLIHANLEHPFAYLYVLALFGAIVGQVAWRSETPSPALSRVGLPPAAPRIVSFLVIVAAIVGYITYMPVERATQVLQRQVGRGEPPRPENELAARLNAVQNWSPYADFAETLGLMASVPTEKNAAALADRCEQAVAIAPTPYFLARCAADLYVAGRPERAANFVDSLCKAYPEAVGVLEQSTAFVAGITPAADGLISTCSPATRP